MPLSLTEFNHFYIINKVCGLEKQRHYLESLALSQERRLRFYQNYTGIMWLW